ncbi:MAG: hypothetical protein SPH83_09325 [Treponema sp.]|uniref:hypothetical protein n=1 Tax=Treponema sp. TaxID=166 RepID=UPI00257FC9EF|nr:hypothetical protein [Treponema sp.]MDD6970620.1 hypothetical protein [Spirochaetales bacterium]MDY6190681.1 hypothetical protein [Treponema sp.]
MDNYTINTKQEYIKYKSGIWYLASEILKDYNIENTGTNQYKLYVWIKKQNKLKDSENFLQRRYVTIPAEKSDVVKIVFWEVLQNEFDVMSIDFQTYTNIYAIATVNKKEGKTLRGVFKIFNVETNEKIEATFMSGGQYKGTSIPFFGGIPFGVYDILLPNSAGHFRLEARDDCYGDDKVSNTGKSQLRLHEKGHGTTIGCISIMEDEKWEKIAQMINDAKSTSVTVKSLSRNPLKKGNPEANTKLAILIVENGIENE